MLADIPEKMKSRLRKAHHQAQTGEIYTQEEAHRMMETFVEQHCKTRKYS